MSATVTEGCKPITQLQIGIPGIRHGQCLRLIAENCVNIRVLHLAYLGIGHDIPGMWTALPSFKQLKDLR